jgi:hypothetical protein
MAAPSLWPLRSRRDRDFEILFAPAASQRRTALAFWRLDGKLELIVYPPSPTLAELM